MRRLVRFFDRLEDRIRGYLSHWPIIYSFIGGIGIVLFWKGVWETAEYYPALFGPASLLVGTLVLLATGLLVSFFIGDSIILSGLKHEKKLVEKTELEIHAEEVNMQFVVKRLLAIEKKLDALSEHNEQHTR